MLTGAALGNRRERRVGIDVAAAGTIFEFQHVVVNKRRFNLFVWTLFEITRMATRAVRLISRKFPGDDFVIICVAGTARHPSSMCFVVRRRMGVRHHRCPGCRVSMTLIAGLCCDKMGPGLPCG